MSDETLIETRRGIVGKGHVLTSDPRTVQHRRGIRSNDHEAPTVARSGAVAKKAALTVTCSGSSVRDRLEELPGPVSDRFLQRMNSGHFTRHGQRHDNIVRKGTDAAQLIADMLALLGLRGAVTSAVRKAGHVIARNPAFRHFARTAIGSTVSVRVSA